MISIHAPRVGCDNSQVAGHCRQEISIHAPRVGCDEGLGWQCRHPNHFNPRTPCGVRHQAGRVRDKCHGISIHAPRVGCDFALPPNPGPFEIFQSTHPVWGATSMRRSKHTGYSLFQSTHPVWGATLAKVVFGVGHKISIHAPRVGCDPL